MDDIAEQETHDLYEPAGMLMKVDWPSTSVLTWQSAHPPQPAILNAASGSHDSRAMSEPAATRRPHYRDRQSLLPGERRSKFGNGTRQSSPSKVPQPVSRGGAAKGPVL